MTTLVTRAGKGSALTHAEMDANFTNLNDTDTSIAAALAVHIDDTIDAHVSSAISYLPAGTGAVATDVQTKLRETISVKDFGDSDGVGAITLNVPSQYATIQAAFDYLANKTIAAGTTVQIKVADGTYTFSSSITANHPQGSQISIVGNVTTPTNCVLNFASSDGLYVAPGCTLGEVNGFQFVKTGTKSNFGIYTYGGEISKVGPMVVVDNFYYGISALNGGRIYADGTSISNRVLVTNAGDCAFWAVSGSFVSCIYGEAQNAADPAALLGGGFVAEFSSGMVANFAKATGCKFCGASALSSSAIRAWHSTFTTNGHGVVTGSNGTVEVFDSSVITGNMWYAHYSDGVGQCFGLASATTTGNGFGIEKNPFKISDSNYSASFNSGSLSVNGAAPESATGGDSYLDLNSATAKANLIRSLINGSERGRLWYRSDFSLWELVANSKTLLRAFDTGKTTIGAAAPATTATVGIGVQIPKVSGAPTGSVTDTESGFVPLVYDGTNNKLYVYNGAWKAVTLA